jgi:hypothetical protein
MMDCFHDMAHDFLFHFPEDEHDRRERALPREALAHAGHRTDRVYR